MKRLTVALMFLASPACAHPGPLLHTHADGSGHGDVWLILIPLLALYALLCLRGLRGKK